MTDYEMKRNASGYTDLTAYNGIKNADYAKEKERHRKLIGALLRICELAGYSMESKIVVKDLRTGKVWE